MSVGAADPELYQLADQYDGVAGPGPSSADVGAPPPVVTEAPPSEVAAVAPPPGPDDVVPFNPAAVPEVQTGPDAVAPFPEDAAGGAPLQPDTLNLPPPKPPALTGDPAKDAEANLQWQRDIASHYGAREQEIAKRATSANAQRAQEELAVAKENEKRRADLVAQQQKDRAAAQTQIRDAVDKRAAAMKDLEGPNWAQQHRGRAIMAAVLGGVVQGLQNSALIYSGHAPTAQNQANETINNLIKQDYEQKKARIASMSDALLEARHGYSDLKDNQAAALNDLDAETAAKYKLVAKEAEYRLRQQGASDDDIKQNAVVQNAQQQAAKAEGQILDREAQRKQQAEHNKATEAMANAHLTLQERQVDATSADRRENRYERRREFDERQADRRDKKAEKDDAAADKKKDAMDARTVRDPDTGEPMFLAPTARVVDKLADQIAASRAYTRKVNELADHIDKYGRILNPLSDEGKVRASLAADVQAQGRQVAGVQASDAGQKLEHELIGGSGVGVDRMANTKRLRELSTEANKRLEQHLRSVGTPVEGAARAQAEAAPKMDKATVDKLWSVIDDPRAPAARKQQARDLLRGAGALP